MSFSLKSGGIVMENEKEICFAGEWQHIKKDELAGHIFDSELELASALIHGIEAQEKTVHNLTQPIKFNSNHPT